MTRCVQAFSLSGALLAGAAAHAAPPAYEIDEVGLFDAEHTDHYGNQYNTPLFMAANGTLYGRSNRYRDNDDNIGTTFWMYQNGVITPIGLRDTQHTSKDGVREGAILQVNALGMALGVSEQYNGDDRPTRWETPWISLNGGTIRLGFFGERFTSVLDGRQVTRVSNLNQAGQVAGTSLHFSTEGLEQGKEVWLYENGSYSPIGLRARPYVNQWGNPNALVTALSETGGVTGTAVRFRNRGPRPVHAWVDVGGKARRIGLYSHQFTTPRGYQNSNPLQINSRNEVIGESERFVQGGDENRGNAAWIFTRDETRRIGVFDDMHTNRDGYQYTTAAYLSESGYAAGHSKSFANQRYAEVTPWFFNGRRTRVIDTGSAGIAPGYVRIAGLSDSGVVVGSTDGERMDSVWRYERGDVRRLGLFDTEHTDPYGGQTSEVADDALANRHMNQRGDVLGTSARPWNVEEIGGGQSAWIHSEGTTYRLGFTDERHTRDDGYRWSEPIQVNITGSAIGTSKRYDGDHPLGTSGWFFDGETKTQHSLVFTEPDDSFAETYPMILTDSNVVLGEYRPQPYSSRQAFYWSLSGGFHNLGTLVDGGLTEEGWEYIGQTLFANGLDSDGSPNFIVGYGYKISSGGRDPGLYMLSEIPTPATAATISIASLVIAVNPRRRRTC